MQLIAATTSFCYVMTLRTVPKRSFDAKQKSPSLFSGIEKGVISNWNSFGPSNVRKSSRELPMEVNTYEN